MSHLHPVSSDGRPMHLFIRRGEHWVCTCGAVRDRYGTPLKESA